MKQICDSPVITPPGCGAAVIIPGVGFGPVGGKSGQLGLWQHVGSFWSGTSVQPG
jgi:hypothetical protein